MITAYLIRAIVIAGLIGLAASLVEFALAALGKPRRFVWLVALGLGRSCLRRERLRSAVPSCRPWPTLRKSLLPSRTANVMHCLHQRRLCRRVPMRHRHRRRA